MCAHRLMNCVCVCVCRELVPGCWTTRVKRFLVIGGINTSEQPETFLESESCLRKSVRTLYLFFLFILSVSILFSDWSSLIMWPPAAPALRKTRAELMKEVDAEYYGYRDEDDGVLLPLEAQYEKQGLIHLLSWNKLKQTESNTFNSNKGGKMKGC